MKALKIILVWVGIVAYLVFALSFVGGRAGERVCERISIVITDSLENRFVMRDDVIDILLVEDAKILGYPLSSINTRVLGEKVEKEPFIKKADIYKTVDGVLNVSIQQRRPVLRVINRSGNSYYLDSEGYILPVSDQFTSRILVANGNISEPFIAGSVRSVFDADPPPGRRNEVIYDLYNLAVYLDSSPLWSSQIAQIYVNSKFEFELIPRVGAHVIYLGDASNYELKFRKLEALYLYGLNTRGWNNYESINLKYENQIVCTKR